VKYITSHLVAVTNKLLVPNQKLDTDYIRVSERTGHNPNLGHQLFSAGCRTFPTIPFSMYTTSKSALTLQSNLFCQFSLKLK
jgi:hypothetical protein